MKDPLSGCLENHGGDPNNLCRNCFHNPYVPLGICPEVTRLKSELSQAQDTIAKLQASAGGGQ